MYRKSVRHLDKRRLAALALLLGSTVALAGDGVDAALAGWLDKEITIDSASLENQFPLGGKLTLVYDSSNDVVRFCAKQDVGNKPWHSDLAVPCGVTLTFTRGTRYCTDADVKTGNGETLASCHRLRSREVALSAPTEKGVELNDMIIFLVEGDSGKHDITILVDSPSRVTTGGSTHGTNTGDGGGGGG